MSTPTFPAGRYGRRRKTSRTPGWVVPVLAFLVVVAMLALAVVAYRRQTSDVQASVRSYVVSDENVRLTFVVTKPRNQAATCLLRARDAKGTVVGQERVPVPTAAERVTLTRTLPTRGRAVSAEVLRCAADSG